MKVYEDGAIRFIALSTGDPACCGAHLMVLFPDAPENLEQSCYLVSADEEGKGFGTVTFKDADPTLTPNGIFTMHLKPEVHDGQTFRKSDLAIQINMNDWSVSLE
ncbi:hypothetical protein [Qingshengfaniella alkalisoli]|uniref:Uncharacterized protein n=1 Tax=Qingshengfaniella alkalisoli TaxID=2599296 RepID=A0A5B8ITC7_9RHOB|nr:hypothetical protein [Qingshengfaniella alkalisoli]QDY68191.1 hypothetical protein FPZ52_00110 [Qingshengfaniella alkalisoli]